eukprot:1155262-Pelagomonas_calceolata.AAC.1
MVWRVTTFALMSSQRSACCRCAASNCRPGLVSSQYLISIKCTCRWYTFSWYSNTALAAGPAADGQGGVWLGCTCMSVCCRCGKHMHAQPTRLLSMTQKGLGLWILRVAACVSANSGANDASVHPHKVRQGPWLSLEGC